MWFSLTLDISCLRCIGVFKLVLEMQVNVAWFDLAWLQVPIKKSKSHNEHKPYHSYDGRLNTCTLHIKWYNWLWYKVFKSRRNYFTLLNLVFEPAKLIPKVAESSFWMRMDAWRYPEVGESMSSVAVSDDCVSSSKSSAISTSSGFCIRKHYGVLIVFTLLFFIVHSDVNY